MNQKRGGFKRRATPANGNDAGADAQVEAPRQEDVDILVTVDEAAKICRMSKAMFYKLHAAGKTPRRIKLGALARWRRRELLDWIRADCPPREKWEAMRGKGHDHAT
jgi:predicted DNA-binding transcriptional regulator AlpA